MTNARMAAASSKARYQRLLPAFVNICKCQMMDQFRRLWLSMRLAASAPQCPPKNLFSNLRLSACSVSAVRWCHMLSHGADGDSSRWISCWIPLMVRPCRPDSRWYATLWKQSDAPFWSFNGCTLTKPLERLPPRDRLRQKSQSEEQLLSQQQTPIPLLTSRWESVLRHTQQDIAVIIVHFRKSWPTGRGWRTAASCCPGTASNMMPAYGVVPDKWTKRTKEKSPNFRESAPSA